VGKSTLTMGLAQALNRSGAAVAVLDADLNGPSQARLAGLEGAPWVPTGRGLAMPRRPDGLGVVSMGSVLAGGSPLEFATVSRGEGHTWRATRELAFFGQLLATVDWGALDVLLLDLPPGAERTVHFAEMLASTTGAEGERAPAFVLVTLPSELARGVVARSLVALRAAGGRVLGTVENMAGYWCRECGAVRPLFPRDAGGELDAPRLGPSLGEVPFDPELAALCDRGWPAAEVERGAAGAAVAAIDRIAGRLAEALALDLAPPAGAAPDHRPAAPDPAAEPAVAAGVPEDSR
jgi:ATP-binding protein involved in chromosome partitioning